MKFYSSEIQPATGPVVMLPQEGSPTGGSRRPLNSWAILRDGGMLLVDAPFSWTLDGIEALIDRGHRPEGLILTHSDLSTSGDAFEAFRERWSVPVWMHADDRMEKAGFDLPVTLLDPREEPFPAGYHVDWLHVPGHTPGSMMLHVDESILLAGDCAVGPGPGQDAETPRLQRPVMGDDVREGFIARWRQIAIERRIDAVLPLHGRWYARADLGDAAFDAAIAHIWDGPPMDPSTTDD